MFYCYVVSALVPDSRSFIGVFESEEIGGAFGIENKK
jgi:hypothetical protein